MQIEELISFSLRSLRAMQLPASVFCLERVRGVDEPHGLSLRYSLMTLIGLAKASAARYEHPFDVEAIHTALLAQQDADELRPGDFGLYLWADAVLGAGHADEHASRLRDSLSRAGGIESLEGMEVAWIVHGAALQGRRDVLADALELMLGRNRSPSGLFFHRGTGARRRLPNFATQIYSVLALSTVARLGLDKRALPAAGACADRLLALQLPDGGWPWLYDAGRGRVVEDYEVYSVHQHAMAPMGLLSLAEASGRSEYAEAAAYGLGWIFGRNELALDMVDEADGLILRSIRRRRPWDRLALWANSGASLVGFPRPFRGGLTELNATCRPYELGWLLEAWAGREHMSGRPAAVPSAR